MGRSYRGYHISKAMRQDYFKIQRFDVTTGATITIGSAPTWDDCIIFIDREIQRLKEKELMANVYRGYRIIFNSTENAYRVIQMVNGREKVIARRESEKECHMFIDDTIDGTDKEGEWERQQVL